jgi:hypothetical protein
MLVTQLHKFEGRLFVPHRTIRSKQYLCNILIGLLDCPPLCPAHKQVCSQHRHQSSTNTWYFRNRAQFLPAEYRARRTSKPRRARQCDGALHLSVASDEPVPRLHPSQRRGRGLAARGARAAADNADDRISSPHIAGRGTRISAGFPAEIGRCSARSMCPKKT